ASAEEADPGDDVGRDAIRRRAGADSERQDRERRGAHADERHRSKAGGLTAIFTLAADDRADGERSEDAKQVGDHRALTLAGNGEAIGTSRLLHRQRHDIEMSRKRHAQLSSCDTIAVDRRRRRLSSRPRFMSRWVAMRGWALVRISKP